MYPEIEPYESGHIAVGDGHSLYYELCGNPDGKPVVYVHGGPGGGVMPELRRYFDPDKYKIILFDQRGAGKSTPFGSIDNNTIEHLVADMEFLRQKLDIAQWMLVGGSWGSTLSLFYLVEYPQYVSEVALSGIFFGDTDGMHWLTEEGYVSEIMPEWFAPYRDHIPEDKRKDGLHKAYYDIILNGTDEEILEAAKQAVLWDTAILTFDLPVDRIKHVQEHPEEYLGLFKLWMHFSNNFYGPHNKKKILDGVQNLGHIPCYIIHGRFDLICPVRNAFDLHAAYPGSTLYVLEKTGHTMREPNIWAKLIEVTDSLVV